MKEQMTNDIKHSPHLTQDEIELLVKAGVDTTDERFSAPSFKDRMIMTRNLSNVPEEFYHSIFNWVECTTFHGERGKVCVLKVDLIHELINHCFDRIEEEKERKE